MTCAAVACSILLVNETRNSLPSNLVYDTTAKVIPGRREGPTRTVPPLHDTIIRGQALVAGLDAVNGRPTRRGDRGPGPGGKIANSTNK